MPRSQRSAVAMAVALGGGVERRRRLEGQGGARVERANRLERVLQEAVNQGYPVFGDRDTGEADSLAHLVHGDIRVSIAHGRASFARMKAILQARPSLHNEGPLTRPW